MNHAPKIKRQHLHGDLDNIILTALRKEPARRYASVEDFSEDISRYLNGLPVKARPNTFFYRAAKFYARNKTASVIGVFLVLSLIAGIIATSWQAVVARRQRDRAEKRFEDVRKLSNSLLFEITPKIERLPGSTEAREIVVRRALEYLDSLSSESQNDLSLQSELASAYEAVGDVQGNPGKANLGDLQGGIESYRKAQAIRLNLAEKNPGDFETQRLLAANYNSIGDFRWWASDVEGALADYEKAVGIFEKLAAQNPDDLQINLDLLNAVLNKIKVISYNGRYEESIRQYGEVLQKAEKLEEKFPQNVELQRIKAHSLMRGGYDLSWQNRYDILNDYVKKSLAIYEPLLAANPNDARIRRDVYFAYFQAGGIYIEDDPQLSRRYLEKGVEIAKNTVARDELNYLAKHDLAQSYSKLGELAAYQKKYAEAADYLSRAEAILTDLTRAEPKHEGYKYSLANNYARLAAAQEGAGNIQSAIENFEKAVAEHEELYRGDTKNNMSIRAIAVAEQDLGRVYEKLRQPQKALDFYRKSVEMFTLLEQKNALGDYDRKNLEAVKKAVEKLEKTERKI
jgi:eukaryotic-like serine/threonine-protein kinase